MIGWVSAYLVHPKRGASEVSVKARPAAALVSLLFFAFFPYSLPSRRGPTDDASRGGNKTTTLVVESKGERRIPLEVGCGPQRDRHVGARDGYARGPRSSGKPSC